MNQIVYVELLVKLRLAYSAMWFVL